MGQLSVPADGEMDLLDDDGLQVERAANAANLTP